MNGRDHFTSGTADRWRWHREKASSVEYVDIDSTDPAYVLEVAISNYELTGNRFLLAVNVNIVEPTSRDVLDSTRQWKQFRSSSFDELFENDAAEFRELFKASSRKLFEEAVC